MKPRAWTPALPLAAILCGGLIVVGVAKAGFWLKENWSDFRDPGPRRTSEAINAASDKVISERDWIAAGLPAGAAEFKWYRFPPDAKSFESQRSFGNEDRPRGSVRLSIEADGEARDRREFLLDAGRATRVTLSEGFQTGGADLAKSWHVLARERVSSDEYRDLVGACFHDGVSVRVDLEGLVGKDEVAAFQRLIQGAAERLPGVCDADLRTYVERAAAAGKSPR